MNPAMTWVAFPTVVAVFERFQVQAPMPWMDPGETFLASARLADEETAKCVGHRVTHCGAPGRVNQGCLFRLSVRGTKSQGWTESGSSGG